MDICYETMPMTELMAMYRGQGNAAGYGNNRMSVCDCCDCCCEGSCDCCSDECGCIVGLIGCGVIGYVLGKIFGWF